MAFDSYDVHGQLEIKQNQVEGFMEVYAIFPPPSPLHHHLCKVNPCGKTSLPPVVKQVCPLW